MTTTLSGRDGMPLALPRRHEERGDRCAVGFYESLHMHGEGQNGSRNQGRHILNRLVPAGYTMAHAKILIVDDEAVVAEAIRRQLRSLGYLVVGVVPTGSEAVQLAGEQRPDIILMDIKLKGPMDGIEAAGTIQSLYGIPVIYLTAFSDEETLERARPTLPLAYLIKPFVSSDLRATLELALFRHRVSGMAAQRGRWLNAVVQSMGDAVVTVDRQGKVTMLNPAAEAMTGWPQSDAVGKPVDEVAIFLDPDSRRPVRNPALHALQVGTSSGLAQRPFLLIGRQGNEHRIGDTVTVIHDDTGEASGVVMVLRIFPTQGV